MRTASFTITMTLFAFAFASALCLVAQEGTSKQPTILKKAGKLNATEVIEIFARSSFKNVLAERNNEIRAYRFYPHDFIIEHISSSGESTHYWLPESSLKPELANPVSTEDFNRIKRFHGNRYEFIGAKPHPLLDK